MIIKILEVENNVNYNTTLIVKVSLIYIYIYMIFVLEKQYKKIILVEVTLDQILDLEWIIVIENAVLS